MKKQETTISLVLICVIAGVLLLTGFQHYKDLSPHQTITKFFNKLFSADIDEDGLANLFPSENIGIYDQLHLTDNRLNQITSDDIVRVFGIHLREKTNGPVSYEISSNSELAGINYNEGKFVSYDSVLIPFYEIFPNGFNEEKSYPTVVLFSGHGKMDEVAFDDDSYQKGLGLYLAKQGFLVYIMENRGMGKLSYLGDHMRIDAVARMVGGSWYGEITTDALFLLDLVFNKNYTANIGVGGVSTGGALSMLTSAIDDRIIATYVQGYLGSYKTTFGTRGNHHDCNNISNIVNEFDMSDIAAFIFPRSAIYVNGEEDTFYAEDAMEAFKHIENRYSLGNAANKVMFKAPKNTKHEMSVSLALNYFNNELVK